MIAKTLILISLIFLALTCNSCGFLKGILQGEQIKDGLAKNPASFIGKYFEVSTYSAITGAATPEAIWSLRSSAYQMRKGLGYKGALDPNLQDMVKQKYFDTGLLVELNKGNSTDDDKSNLLLQIEEIKEEKGEVLLKVSILNKKYVGSSWWIPSIALYESGAKQIESPYKRR